MSGRSLSSSNKGGAGEGNGVQNSSKKQSKSSAGTNDGGELQTAPFEDHQFLQPSVPLKIRKILDCASNWSEKSRVDVLQVSGKSTDDDAVDRVIRDLNDTADKAEPALLVIIVYLTFDNAVTYKRRASASRNTAEHILREYHIRESCIHNILGRPDYWAPTSHISPDTSTLASDYEFGCQHARWLMKSRWEKALAPCSVYMRRCNDRNLTVYLVSGDAKDSCITTLCEQLGYGQRSPQPPTEQTQRFAAECPFYVHALVLGASFEQSKDYVAVVRDRIMAEIKIINDIIDKSPPSDVDPDSTRKVLQRITQNLHEGSQTTDSGMANVEMSQKLTDAMDEMFDTYTSDADVTSDAVRQTGEAIKYLLSSWKSQKNWLVTYRARKDTAMNFVFNTVTQLDSSVNMEMGRKMSADSSSMNAITILTMVFLPATFISGMFSSGIFSAEEYRAYGKSALFWPFLYTVLPVTVLVFMIYAGRTQLSRFFRLVKKSMHIHRVPSSTSSV